MAAYRAVFPCLDQMRVKEHDLSSKCCRMVLALSLLRVQLQRNIGKTFAGHLARYARHYLCLQYGLPNKPKGRVYLIKQPEQIFNSLKVKGRVWQHPKKGV
jgi:hypothetical protein